MSKVVSSSSEFVKIIERGSMLLSSKSDRSLDVGVVVKSNDGSGVLGVERAGYPYPLWVNREDDMKALFAFGDVTVFSSQEVKKLYSNGRI